MCRSLVFCCRWIYTALCHQEATFSSRVFSEVGCLKMWFGAADRGQPCDAEGEDIVPFLPVQLCLLYTHSSCGLVDAQRLNFLI